MTSHEQQELAASELLPVLEEIRAFNSRANGYFSVQYDGGEFVLWFFDKNGTIVTQPGEPVQRHIQTYTGPPSPEQARSDALVWLGNNVWWL